MAPPTMMLWIAGNETVAAMNSSTTTSITSAKRFCATQLRQSTW